MTENSFKQEMFGVLDEFFKDCDTVRSDILTEASKGLVNLTPIRTGQLVAHWSLTVNGMSANVPAEDFTNTDKDRTKTLPVLLASIPSVPTCAKDSSVYISNPISYGQRVEFELQRFPLTTTFFQITSKL